MTSSRLLSSLLILLSLYAPSSPAESHEIEALTEQCLDNAMTTHAMRLCSVQAFDAWDDELNRVYRRLRPHLDRDGKQRLLQAQRRWLSYRDEEFRLIDALYDQAAYGGGTMWIPLRQQAKNSVVKRRVEALTDYLSELDLLDPHFSGRFAQKQQHPESGDCLGWEAWLSDDGDRIYGQVAIYEGDCESELLAVTHAEVDRSEGRIRLEGAFWSPEFIWRLDGELANGNIEGEIEILPATPR